MHTHNQQTSPTHLHLQRQRQIYTFAYYFYFHWKISLFSPRETSNTMSYRISDEIEWLSRSFTYCKPFRSVILVYVQLTAVQQFLRDANWQWQRASRGPSATAERRDLFNAVMLWLQLHTASWQTRMDSVNLLSVVRKKRGVLFEPTPLLR